MDKFRRRFILAGGLVCVATIVGTVLLNQTAGRDLPNVLLITLDTTRADRIGIYGHESARTPHLDQLARDGVLFERAITPAPLTLPAHASLFTGLYPPEHGLRTNGSGSLPLNLSLMSEILGQEGYATGAFIASFVLDGKFGLNRGFDQYDDDLTEARPTQDAIHRFRDGRLVVDSALKWLATRRRDPFFCWVHLYDPHFPYEPHTDEFGESFADSLYDGEIAYTDRLVGRLLEVLKEHPRTVVIVVGDHGESLGDHFELQHGYTLYDSTQRVPLIIQGVPESIPGTRVSGTVSLVDLLPTVTDILNLPEPKDISGRSLKAELFGNPLEPRSCYGATDDPFLQNGWSPLRSLTTDKWRYIRTTRPELYDLRADPQELHNLADEQPEQIQAFEQELADLESGLSVGEAVDVQLTSAEQRALQSLGYVGGAARSESPQENDLPDVKDMLPFNAATQSAIDLMEQGKPAEAEVILREIVAESPPEHVSSRLYLGSVLEQQGQFDAAQEIYEAVLERRPDDTTALFQLGALYAQQGDFDRAIPIFEQCLALEPEETQPLFNLGLAKSRIGDVAAAEQIFREVLRLDPMFPGAWVALGTLLSHQGRSAAAMAAFSSELKFNPESVEANINLGVQLGGQQQFEEARKHLMVAIGLAPESVDARLNLGICEEMLKNYEAAIQHVEEAIRLRPDSPGIRTALGNILIKAGRSDEAIQAFEAELARTPDWLPAHLRLAALLSEQKRTPEAITHLKAAVRLAPDNVEALFNLGSLYALEGDSENAVIFLERVLRHQPGHVRAATELSRIRNQNP